MSQCSRIILIMQGNLLQANAKTVGSVNPVKDFHELLADKSEDHLVKASKQLFQRIEDLVDLYVGGATDPFLDMVQALRNACVKDEPRLFNDSRLRLDHILEITRHYCCSDPTARSTCAPPSAAQAVPRPTDSERRHPCVFGRESRQVLQTMIPQFHSHPFRKRCHATRGQRLPRYILTARASRRCSHRWRRRRGPCACAFRMFLFAHVFLQLDLL